MTNALCKRPASPASPGTALYGRQFEHFMYLEMRRLADYAGTPASFFHWRDANGHEVDFIVEIPGCLLAVEIKARDAIGPRDLKDLRMFGSLHPEAELVCACLARRAHEADGVTVLPWREFLQRNFPAGAGANG